MKTINLDKFIDSMPFQCNQYRSEIKSKMFDFAKEILKLAAENAEIETFTAETPPIGARKYDVNQNYEYVVADKESILDTINQVV